MIAANDAPQSRPGNGPNPKPSGYARDYRLRAFLGCFYEILEEMAEGGYFTQKCGSECSEGYPIFWCEEKFRKKIQIHAIGIEWPITPGHLDWIGEEVAIRYVEFLYTCVSKPTDGWHHPYCDGWHPTQYDESLGRLEYEARVNQAFDTSKVEMAMKKGQVRSREDEILWGRIEQPLGGGDRQTEMLIETAIELFRSGTEANRISALGSLANAFERLKEHLGSGDKRQAVGGLKLLIGFEQSQVADLDAYFRVMTDFANNTSIRHHEESRPSLVDQPEMVEFFFYSYYNLIRLCLAAKGRVGHPSVALNTAEPAR